MTQDRPTRRGMTLGDAVREFWRHPSPWLITAALAIAVVAHVLAGDWQWTDALMPFIVLAVFPFVEWMIHVFHPALAPAPGGRRSWSTRSWRASTARTTRTRRSPD